MHGEKVDKIDLGIEAHLHSIFMTITKGVTRVEPRMRHIYITGVSMRNLVFN